MAEDETDDEYLDDPIRLFDTEWNRVCFCPDEEEVDDPGKTVDGKRSNRDDILYLYKNNVAILPVTFFDIDRNVKLLKRCRPLSIKLIDCDKYPQYIENVIDLTKDDLNTNGSNLQEIDCVEILSSYENEKHDTVIKRSISKDLTNISNEFRDICYEHKQDLVTEKQVKKEMQKEDDRYRSIKKNVDFEGNNQNSSQSIIVYNSQSCKGKRDTDTYRLGHFEETYFDNIDTYARLVDKAYQKLQKRYEVPTNKCDTNNKNNDDSKYANETQINKKPKLHENCKTNQPKHKSYSINHFNDCIKTMNEKSHIFSGPMINNLDPVTTRDISLACESQTSKPEKIKNVFEESHIKTSTTEDNNGACSPLLPCPQNTSNSNNSKNMKKMPNNQFLSRRSINKGSVCEKHLFSANRVIPHYHNESLQVSNFKLSKLTQNTEKSTPNNNGKNNYQPNSNQTSSSNGFMRRFTNINLNQESMKHKNNQNIQKSRQSEESIAHGPVSSSDQFKRSKYNEIPTVSNMPVNVHQKANHIGQTFPIQRIITNRNMEPKDFSVTTQNSIHTVHRISQHPKNVYQNNIYSSHVNNNHNVQVPANFYEQKSVVPPVHSDSQLMYSTIERLPKNQHCIRRGPIMNTKYQGCDVINNRNTINNNNVKRNEVLLGDNNTSNVSKQPATPPLMATSSCVNQGARKAITNKNNVEDEACAREKLQSVTVSIPLTKSIKINQPMDEKCTDAEKRNRHILRYKNKNMNYNDGMINDTELLSDRYSNINKQTMLAALLATDYVYQKTNAPKDNAQSNHQANKHPHLKQYLEQPLRIPTCDNRTTMKIEQIDPNSDQSVPKLAKSVSKGYSPPILPIPTYQKTFEILARIKVYDLERGMVHKDLNKKIDHSKSSVNSRKRKINDNVKISRKISISEYKKRLHAKKNNEEEDFKVIS